MTDAAEDWNKAERLAVAGAVAPRLRSQDDKTKSRRVALVDKDGKVTGYTTLAQVQKSLLKAREIELDVQDGVRPKEVLCKHCGKTVKVPPKGGKCGQPPTVCIDGCRQTCSESGCNKSVTRGAARSSARAGRAIRCLSCATKHHAATLSPEQKTAKGRKSYRATTPKTREIRKAKFMASLTPESRKKMSDNARAQNAAMTEEQRDARKERMRKMQASLSPEKRREMGKKAMAKRTPEERMRMMEASRKAQAERPRTPEQWAESRRIGWEKRRANAAAKKAAAENTPKEESR
jgi:hypothetical protein